MLTHPPRPFPLTLFLTGAATGSNWGYIVHDEDGVERNARMDIDNGSNRYVIYASGERYHINTKYELEIGYVHKEGGRTFTVKSKLESGTKKQQEAAAKVVV